MAKYYHSDVARWEGEGGATADVPSYSTRQFGDTDRKNRSLVILQILSGVLIGAAFVYARRKVWF